MIIFPCFAELLMKSVEFQTNTVNIFKDSYVNRILAFQIVVDINKCSFGNEEVSPVSRRVNHKV